jgi:NitT/TauT family transport system permease protein
MSPRSTSRIERIAYPLAALVVFAALWHLAVRWSGTNVFPTPGDTLVGMAELARSGALGKHVKSSLVRVFAGYGLAVVVGMPVGLLMGTKEAAARAINPVVQFLRPISPIAWIPVAIVVFGVSNAAPISLVFLGALWPIVVSSMNAVRNVDAIFVRVGRNFGLSPRAVLWRVTLPGALPQILTGLRVALGIAWLVLVAAEMLAVTSGLGYMVLDARNAGKRYDIVVAGMVLIGAIGLVLDTLLRRMERLPAFSWGKRGNT